MDQFVSPDDFTVEWACPPAEAAPAVLSGRVLYVLEREGWWPLRILADFFPDGTEDFGEQEAGEHNWYPHRPSAREWAFAYPFQGDLARIISACYPSGFVARSLAEPNHG